MLSAAASVLGPCHLPTVVARDRELSALRSFLAAPSTLGRRVLFVTGSPAAGKSLCVRHALDTVSPDLDICTAWVNAATLSRPENVYQALLSALTGSQQCQPAARARDLLLGFLGSRSRDQALRYVVVIDEVDQLQTDTFEVLYFVYGTLPEASCLPLVITIATSSAFTEANPRVLSRARASQQLAFRNYTHAECSEIIRSRLEMLGSMHPDVLERFGDMEVIRVIVERADQLGGDLGMMLQLTLRALSLSVTRNHRAVLMEDVDTVTRPNRSDRDAVLLELTPLEQGILRLAAEEEGASVTACYTLPAARDVSTACVTNALRRLVDGGFLDLDKGRVLTLLPPTAVI
ncbi:Orc1/CDC6 [Giardia muris]|uniref:Origin recognition complex subunit 1 n=1 Tax=Giardia muris TaxID=5742 RepID=A0A4Z1SLB4_GIAMU|nr:Orc1/CDC6 [Giardia muris]|eukprot:TNJ26426.1 Orc1/CDC6 [Giardia muris]